MNTKPSTRGKNISDGENSFMKKDVVFEKTVDLGKVAYSYKNRKCNSVDLNVLITSCRTAIDADYQMVNNNLVVTEKGKTGIYNWDTLKLIKEEKVISISVGIWNHMHTDYMMCGQCLDDLLQLMPDNEVLKIIYPIWKEYHSNNLHAGTKGQEEALQAYFTEISQDYDFGKAVEYLQLIGLYEDRGYKYGSSWLIKPVPDEVVQQLIQVCDPVSQL